MTPNITWTRRAEEKLGTALRRTQGQTQSPAKELADINKRLAGAFPHAADVVVLNHYVGFKHRPNEHILQVDVRQPNDDRTYVVKLAGHERLSREQSAWALCKITGANPVFMPLQAWPSRSRPPRSAHRDCVSGRPAAHRGGGDGVARSGDSAVCAV